MPPQPIPKQDAQILPDTIDKVMDALSALFDVSSAAGITLSAAGCLLSAQLFAVLVLLCIYIAWQLYLFRVMCRIIITAVLVLYQLLIMAIICMLVVPLVLVYVPVCSLQKAIRALVCLLWRLWKVIGVEHPPNPLGQASALDLRTALLCSICMQAGITSWSVSTCGHVYCTSCMQRVMQSTKQCPTCNRQLKQAEVFPLYL